MDKDISTLLREIKAATCWSETRISEELGTSQPTVNRILAGQPDCMGATRRAIDALHGKVVGKQTSAAPRRATDPEPVAGPDHAMRQPPGRANVMEMSAGQVTVYEVVPKVSA